MLVIYTTILQPEVRRDATAYWPHYTYKKMPPKNNDLTGQNRVTCGYCGCTEKEVLLFFDVFKTLSHGFHYFR